MSDSGNTDQVMGWLDAFIDSIQFTRKGKEKTLGQDIADAIIRGPEHGEQGGIMGRCAREITPDGSPWPPNSAEYAQDKEEKYGWSETNRRTNQMLSEPSLYGKTRIEPEQVTLIYGEDKPPSQSHSPTGYLSPGDAKVTDVQKAQFAHAAGRGFYGIGEGDPENVSKVGQAAVDHWIREAGGG
jgi:hypothetical protein